MSTFSYYTSSGPVYPQRERLTWAVQRLLLLHVAVFAIQLLLHIAVGGPGDPRTALLGGPVTQWLLFDTQRILSFEIWRPFTYLLLHASLTHLFFNMIGLFFFGPEVERLFGTRQFFRFYVLCGAVAVLASLIPAAATGSHVRVMGASGAVMAVLVAFATVYPDREVFLIPIPFPINARALILVFIVLNIVAAAGSVGVSVATHFGGMLCGFAYVKLVPLMRRWNLPRIRINTGRRKTGKAPGDDMETLGRAVDNIFKFREKGRHKSGD